MVYAAACSLVMSLHSYPHDFNIILLSYSLTIVLTVQFSQTNYFGLETSGIISVTLLLGGGTSANDITVTVILSDQSPVSAEGK